MTESKFINEIQPDETFPPIREQVIISLKKFILFSVLSFGIYTFWWTFKEWRFFMQKDQLNINPTMRAVFSVFYLYPLFKKILLFAQEKSYIHKYSPFLMFLGAILLSIIPMVSDSYWILSVFSFIFYIPAFNALNYAKLKSDQLVIIQNKELTVIQICLIAIGLILWILILVGLIMEGAAT